MKKKNFVDQDVYEKIMIAMKKVGITNAILSLARKMDMNLPRMFYEKLIQSKTKEDKDSLSKNLIGIYGNFLATYYYNGIGYKVENELPVCDEEGKVVTKVDLAFLDKDGNHNYCEVKMAPQIIDNIRNYYEDEKLENGNYEDKDNEIIKYKNIGKKLINQVCKLKKTNKKVIVVVPEDCIIDNVIKNELLKQDVEIKRIAIKFKDLEMLTKKIIDDFIKEYNKKTHSKIK